MCGNWKCIVIELMTRGAPITLSDFERITFTPIFSLSILCEYEFHCELFLARKRYLFNFLVAFMQIITSVERHQKNV